MARAADTPSTRRSTYHRDDMVRFLFTKVTLILAELDALYAKMDADAGITDTNYTALQQALTKAMPSLFDG